MIRKIKLFLKQINVCQFHPHPATKINNTALTAISFRTTVIIVAKLSFKIVLPRYVVYVFERDTTI